MEHQCTVDCHHQLNQYVSFAKARYTTKEALGLPLLFINITSCIPVFAKNHYCLMPVTQFFYIANNQMFKE